MTDREYNEADKLLNYLENTTYDDPELIKEIVSAVRLLLMDMIERGQISE